MHASRKFSRRLVSDLTSIPVVVLFALGQVLDLTTTFIALTFYGAREGNPLLFWVNSKIPGRWIALTGLKLYTIKESNFYRKNPEYLGHLIVLTFVTWVVVLCNFGVILRRRNARS